MTNYERLTSSPDAEGVNIYDYQFRSARIKGLYCDGNVAINKSIDTDIERTCILAEELGHYHTSTGDILDQSDPANRKQELRARMWGYNKLIGLYGIINSYRSGCRDVYEMADRLNVTAEYLTDALQAYKRKYGVCTRVDNYVIYFEPVISVLELI